MNGRKTLYIWHLYDEPQHDRICPTLHVTKKIKQGREQFVFFKAGVHITQVETDRIQIFKHLTITRVTVFF